MTKIICYFFKGKYKDRSRYIYFYVYIYIGGIMYIMIIWVLEGLILLVSLLL